MRLLEEVEREGQKQRGGYPKYCDQDKIIMLVPAISPYLLDALPESSILFLDFATAHFRRRSLFGR